MSAASCPVHHCASSSIGGRRPGPGRRGGEEAALAGDGTATGAGRAAPPSPLLRWPLIKRNRPPLPLPPRGPAAPRPSWPACGSQLRLVKAGTAPGDRAPNKGRRRCCRPPASRRPPPLPSPYAAEGSGPGHVSAARRAQRSPAITRRCPPRPLLKGRAARRVCTKPGSALTPPPRRQSPAALQHGPPAANRRGELMRERGERRAPRLRAGRVWARGAAVAGPDKGLGTGPAQPLGGCPWGLPAAGRGWGESRSRGRKVSVQLHLN